MNAAMSQLVKSKSGSEMVEAAIIYPVIIMAVMLMLRLFTFYLEILNTGIKSHEKAMSVLNKTDRKVIEKYEDDKTVKLLPGGILFTAADKKIRTRAYIFNEDVIVRAGEVLEK